MRHVVMEKPTRLHCKISFLVQNLGQGLWQRDNPARLISQKLLLFAHNHVTICPLFKIQNMATLFRSKTTQSLKILKQLHVDITLIFDIMLSEPVQ